MRTFYCLGITRNLPPGTSFAAKLPVPVTALSTQRRLTLHVLGIPSSNKFKVGIPTSIKVSSNYLLTKILKYSTTCK